MKIVVFGGGMQGRVIASNLIGRPEKPSVVVADLRKPAELLEGCDFLEVDVLDARAVSAAVEGADAAVLAVPSPIAHRALQNLVATGVAVADVSFTPDPPLDLDESARKTGSCCVVDCGIAPGLSHLLVGRAYQELGGLDYVRILVGGIPQEPQGKFQHAVYFNPSDLIAEYVRPARAREAGKEVSPHPMSVSFDRHDIGRLGELESFLSDGLRSLLTSFPDVHEMSERTLRWPGHLDTMHTLCDVGLFDDSASNTVASLLHERYPADSYPDYLVMQVEAGKGDARRAWFLLDRHTAGESAMSRTTGYTTAATAMVLARKQFSEAGVHPPERLGMDAAVASAIIDDLKERGIELEVASPQLQKTS